MFACWEDIPCSCRRPCKPYDPGNIARVPQRAWNLCILFLASNSASALDGLIAFNQLADANSVTFAVPMTGDGFRAPPRLDTNHLPDHPRLNLHRPDLGNHGALLRGPEHPRLYPAHV